MGQDVLRIPIPIQKGARMLIASEDPPKGTNASRDVGCLGGSSLIRSQMTGIHRCWLGAVRVQNWRKHLEGSAVRQARKMEEGKLLSKD